MGRVEVEVPLSGHHSRAYDRWDALDIFPGGKMAPKVK